MIESRRKESRFSQVEQNLKRAIAIAMEPLESRQMLSVSAFGGRGGHDDHGGGPGGGPGGGLGGFGRGGGGSVSTIEFSLAPTAVQTGLDSLATADSLTDPAATDKVELNNVNGVETYSVTINSTGTVSKLTVDQFGDAVTAPTQTTTTWATLSGTGTGSDSAAAAEINAIASALDLTAPISTTTVNITTTSTGVVTYSVDLTGTTTADDDYAHGQRIAVDAVGNPVGNQQVPFSVLSTAIQTGLNSHAPTGATALATNSTQLVGVKTTDGVVTYSTTYTVTGTQSTVTVNAAGTLTSLPTTTTTTFSALSSAVQTELQTLATADGVTTTIATTQSVTVLTETNGTIIYSVQLSATDATDASETHDITIAVDSSGNPTTLPRDGLGDGFGGTGKGGDCGSPTGGTNSSTGTTTNSSSGTVSINSSGGSAATASLVSPTTAGTYELTARVLGSAINSLGFVGGYFVLFSPATEDATVKADLTQISSDQSALAADTRTLSGTEKKTLKADEKAIAAAIKAISATLNPLEKSLKSDSARWSKTIAADLKAIKADKNDAAALATAKAKLTSDRASAFAAIAADQQDILTAISSDAGVSTAQAKLATDLPVIAAAQEKLQSDQSQLVSDIE